MSKWRRVAESGRWTIADWLEWLGRMVLGSYGRPLVRDFVGEVRWQWVWSFGRRGCEGEWLSRGEGVVGSGARGGCTFSPPFRFDLFFEDHSLQEDLKTHQVVVK
jgi:hypothetical protein